jgi:hypothetical protein
MASTRIKCRIRGREGRDGIITIQVGGGTADVSVWDDGTGNGGRERVSLLLSQDGMNELTAFLTAHKD